MSDITLSLSRATAEEALVDFASYGSRALVVALVASAKESGNPFNAADLNEAAAAAEKGGHRVLANLLDEERIALSRPQTQAPASTTPAPNA